MLDFCALEWPEARRSTLDEPAWPGGRPGFSSLISGFLLPQLEPRLKAALRIEVRLQFAQAGLRARRDGVSQAREWLMEQRDPFSGGEFHLRVDPGHGFRVWSVGANLEDYGGRSFADADLFDRYDERFDIVWEYRGAE